MLDVHVWAGADARASGLQQGSPWRTLCHQPVPGETVGELLDRHRKAQLVPVRRGADECARPSFIELKESTLLASLVSGDCVVAVPWYVDVEKAWEGQPPRAFQARRAPHAQEVPSCSFAGASRCRRCGRGQVAISSAVANCSRSSRSRSRSAQGG